LFDFLCVDKLLAASRAKTLAVLEKNEEY